MAGKQTYTIEVNAKGFDKLKKQIESAGGSFDVLSKSQRSADRTGKGLSNQSSNQTKNFSKIQQGISGGLVPAYATLAAQVFAVTAAFQFLSNSVNFRNLIKGQEAFGGVTGMAFKTITEQVRAATEGQLAYQDAAQAVAIGTAGGLSRQQIVKLGEAAKNTSLALGRDLTDSFNRLTRGVTKAEPELLDELGIILRLDPALKNYASSIGKTKEELNQFEKSQAVANEVLGQADSKFGRITEIMDPAAFALGQFSAKFDDLLNVIKQGVGFLAEKLLPFFTENVLALVSALGLFALPIIKSIANFEQMEINARANLKGIQAGIQETRLELEAFKTAQAAAGGDKKSIKALGATGQKGAKSILSGAGVKTNKNLTQAQVAAYKRSLKHQNGIFNKLNAQQRKQFKLHLDQMDIAHKASLGKQVVATKIAEKQKQGLYQMTALQFARIQAGMVKVAQFSALQMSRAFSAAGYIGMFLLAASAVGAFINRFREIDEVAQNNRDAFKEQANTLKTLNKELEKMIQLRREGLVTDKESILQSGNAILTADSRAIVQQFQLDRAKRGAFEEKVVGSNFIGIKGKRKFGAQTREEVKAELGSDAIILGRVPIEAMVMTEEFKAQAEESSRAISNLAEIAIDGKLKLAYRKLAQEIQEGLEPSKSNLEVIAEQEKKMTDLTAILKNAGEAQKVFNNALQGAVGKKLFGANLRSGAQGMADTQGALLERNRMAFGAEFEEDFNSGDEIRALQAQKRFMRKLASKEGQEYQDEQRNIESRKKGFEKIVAEVNKINKLEREILENGTSLREQQVKRSIAIGLDAQILEKTNDAERESIKVMQHKAKITDLERAKDIAKINFDAEKDEVKKEEKKLLFDLAKANMDMEIRLTPIIEEQERIEKSKLEIKKLQMQQTTEMMKLQEKQIDLEIQSAATASFLKGTGMGKNFSERVKIQQMLLTIEEKKAAIADQRETRQAQIDKKLLVAGSVEDQNTLAKIALDEKRLTLLEEQARVAEEAASIMGKLQNSFARGIEDMFVAIAQGSKSAKEAFKDMALMMLKQMAQIAAQQLALRALGFMGFPTPMATGGVIPMATGGVMRGYSTGGIATQPTYLVGEGKYNEAVVPLPDGRTIPVEMRGGAGNNITVNVDANGGQQTTMDGEQGAALGKAIAATVMETLQREKRPGGVLSR